MNCISVRTGLTGESLPAFFTDTSKQFYSIHTTSMYARIRATLVDIWKTNFFEEDLIENQQNN